MNKNISTMLVAAIAGIIIAGTFAVVLPSAALADNHRKSSDVDLKAGNGGIGGAGGAGGVGGNGGSNHNDQDNKFGHNDNDQDANGGNANGGNGGDANGGNACIKAGCRS
jgi:hypothetical protein